MVDIFNLQRRTERYEFVDGIRSFHTAVSTLILGIFGWIILDLPDVWLPPMQELSRWQGRWFAAALMFIIPGGLVFFTANGVLHLMNEYLRRRWLWRKTGVVKPKSWVVPPAVIFTGLAFPFIGFIVGFLLANQVHDGWIMIRGILLGTAWGTAYMNLAIGKRLKLSNYYVVAVVGAIGSLVILLLPVTLGFVGLLLSVLWAGLLIISGLYAMYQTAILTQGLADEE